MGDIKNKKHEDPNYSQWWKMVVGTVCKEKPLFIRQWGIIGWTLSEGSMKVQGPPLTALLLPLDLILDARTPSGYRHHIRETTLIDSTWLFLWTDQTKGNPNFGPLTWRCYCFHGSSHGRECWATFGLRALWSDPQSYIALGNLDTVQERDADDSFCDRREYPVGQR